MVELKKLQINQLLKIDEILDKLLLLEYSTQKRNLAYVIQLKQFFTEIESHYEINKGLAKMYKYNILRINADIIETLLYCACIQCGFKIPQGKGLAMKVINLAKTKGIILKSTAKRATKIIRYRNDLHPYEQTELLSKVSDIEFIEAEETVKLVYSEVYRSLKIEQSKIPF